MLSYVTEGQLLMFLDDHHAGDLSFLFIDLSVELGLKNRIVEPDFGTTGTLINQCTNRAFQRCRTFGQRILMNFALLIISSLNRYILPSLLT